MKKRLITALLLSALALALCACNEPVGTTKDSVPQSEPSTPSGGNPDEDPSDPGEEDSKPDEDPSNPGEEDSKPSYPEIDPDDPWTPWV